MLTQIAEIVSRCLGAAGILAAAAFLIYGWVRGRQLKKEMRQKQKLRRQY